MSKFQNGKILISAIGPVRCRRVIAVYDEIVAYSSGGDTTRYCKEETLERWCKRANAYTPYPRDSGLDHGPLFRGVA